MNKDNAEGSSVSCVELSQQQRDILVGTLLGDGCLAMHGNHARLHIKHKVAQVDLVELKYEAFREFISMPMHHFDQQLLGNDFPCVQFATKTHPVFSYWRSRFYVDRRKVVPPNIATLLTPLALAVWFMDDGAADYAGVTFQTHNYQLGEVELLTAVLRSEFDLAVSIQQNKGKHIIYVKAESIPRLQKMIGCHVLESLQYKLQPRRKRTP